MIVLDFIYEFLVFSRTFPTFKFCVTIVQILDRYTVFCSRLNKEWTQERMKDELREGTLQAIFYEHFC